MITVHNLKIFKGASLLTVGDLLAAVLELVRISLITHLFSLADFGLYGIAIGTAQIFKSFVLPGFRQVIPRFYPQFNKENPDKAKQFFFSTFIFAILNSLAVIAVAYVFSTWISTAYYQKPELLDYPQVSLWLILIDSLNAYSTAMLMSLEKFKSVFWINLLQSVASLLGVVGIALWGGDISILLFTLLLAIALRVGVSVILLIPHLKFTFPRLDKQILRFWSSFVANSFFSGLTTDLPSVILGRMLTSSDVGLYKIAEKTLQMMITLIGPYVSTVSTICLNVYHTSQDQFIKLLRQHFKLIGIVHLALAGLAIIVARPLFALLYGDEYNAAVPIFVILSFYALFYGSLFYQRVIYSVTNQTKQFFYFSILSSLLFFVMLWTGAFLYGLIGAAVATVLARVAGFFLALIMTPRVMRGAIQYRSLTVPILIAALFDAVILNWMPETLIQSSVMGALYIPLFLVALLLTKSLDPRFLIMLKTAWSNRGFNPQPEPTLES